VEAGCNAYVGKMNATLKLEGFLACCVAETRSSFSCIVYVEYRLHITSVLLSVLPQKSRGE